MAKHLHDQDDYYSASALQWRIALDSDALYNRYFVNCVNKGLIVKYTKAAFNRAKFLVNGSRFINRNASIISNDKRTTSKNVGVLSSGIPHSPVREMQESSLRIRKLPFLADTLLELCRIKGFDDPHAFMVTLTTPNCDLGGLNDALNHYDWALAKLKDAFKKGTKKGNGGIRLVDEDGDVVRWVGNLVTIEVTCNGDCLGKHDKHGVFHPHVHMILIVDGELDLATRVTVTKKDVPNMTKATAEMNPNAAILFKWWAKHNPKSTLSPDAFDLKPAFAKDDKRSIHTQFVSAFTEAAKYAVKPELWKRLPNNPDSFSLKVFAELFNSLQKTKSGRTLHRNQGLLFAASGFLGFCNTNGLGEAVLDSGYKDIDNGARVPDLYTTVSEHVLKDNKSSWKNVRKLNDEQLLWFNRDILEKSGFDADLLDQVDWPKTEKSDLYHELLVNLMFTDRGKQGLLGKLDLWCDALQEMIDDVQLKLADLDAQEKRGRKINKTYRADLEKRKAMFEAKLDDTTRVRDAVSNLIWDDKTGTYDHGNGGGIYGFYVNWSHRALTLNVFDAMAAMEQKTGELWADLPEHRHDTSDNEKLLLDLFGRDFLCGDPNAKFLDDRWVGAYLCYAVMGHDNVSDLLWRVTKNSSFNSVIESTLWGELSDMGVVEKFYDCVNYFKTDCKVKTAQQLQKIVSKLG